jgi:hypothetical protein
MERRSVEAIVRALNEAQVRYLIVGGLAVVAHGYPRLTVDVDLVIDLSEVNLRSAMNAFERLGFKPKAPVKLEQFADRSQRESWVHEKNMLVFRIYSDRFPGTDVDIFPTMPFDFERAYADSQRFELAVGATMPVVGVNDLINMKEQAGRPKDLEDVRVLRRLLEGPHET